MNETSAQSNEHSLSQFDADFYKPDGGYTFPSLFQLTISLIIVGLIMGMLAHYIGQFFWLIILFPIVIGGVVGFCGSYCVNKYHIRSPLLCAFAGIAAGVFSMSMMHYLDYRSFRSELNANLGENAEVIYQIARNIDEIKAKGDEIPEEVRLFIKDLENNPQDLKQLQIESFPQFIDYQAEIGVQIGKVGREMNIGYVGSYIYWAVEIFLVAIIALLIMKSTAEEPYCSECASWKTEQSHGPFRNDNQIMMQLRHGQQPNVELNSEIENKSHDEFLVKLHSCSHCQEESPVDVFVEQIVVDKEGNASEKNIAKMTYPPEAYVALHAHCASAAEALVVPGLTDGVADSAEASEQAEEEASGQAEENA